jgi:hypothetical protein
MRNEVNREEGEINVDDAWPPERVESRNSSSGSRNGSIKERVSNRREYRAPRREPMVVESRSNSVLDRENSSEEEDLDEEKRRYEKFEIKINKRKGGRGKLWEWVDMKDKRVEKIEVEERGKKRRRDKKKLFTYDIFNRERADKRAMLAMEDIGNREERDNFETSFSLDEQRRMMVAIFAPNTNPAQFEGVIGALHSSYIKGHALMSFLSKRGWAFFVTRTRGHAERLLASKMAAMRFIQGKLINRRHNYSTVTVEGNLSSLNRGEVIAMVEGALGVTILGGWTEGMGTGQIYLDMQLSWEELEEKVEETPDTNYRGVSIQFSVARPVESEGKNVVFVRNMGVGIEPSEAKAILSAKFGKKKERRKEKSKEKKRVKTKEEGKEKRKREEKWKRKETNFNQDSRSRAYTSSLTQTQCKLQTSARHTSSRKTKLTGRLHCQVHLISTGRQWKFKGMHRRYVRKKTKKRKKEEKKREGKKISANSFNRRRSTDRRQRAETLEWEDTHAKCNNQYTVEKCPLRVSQLQLSGETTGTVREASIGEVSHKSDGETSVRTDNTVGNSVGTVLQCL